MILKIVFDVGTGPGRYCIDISRNNVNTLGVDVFIRDDKIS